MFVGGEVNTFVSHKVDTVPSGTVGVPGEGLMWLPYGFMVLAKRSGCQTEPVDLAQPADDLVPTGGHWGHPIRYQLAAK